MLLTQESIQAIRDQHIRERDEAEIQAQKARIAEVSYAIITHYTRTQFEQLGTTAVRTAVLPHLNTKQYAQALRLIGVKARHSTRLPDGSITKCHKILPDSMLTRAPDNWYTAGNILYTSDNV